MGLSLEAIAEPVVRNGEYEQAVALYAAASSLLEKSKQAHSPTELADREPEFGLAKDKLDRTVYEKAWDLGADMTEDETIEFATGLLSDLDVVS